MIVQKIPIEELNKMSSSELSKHIEDITQTEICKDEEYCKKVVSLFVKTPRFKE